MRERKLGVRKDEHEYRVVSLTLTLTAVGKFANTIFKGL